MGAIVSFDASWRPEITRRIQMHDHAMGPLRRVLLNKGTLSVEAKVRYCEALAFSKLFQQMEIWHDLGVSNEDLIQAAYVGALRAAAGMVHVANNEEHFTDDAVFLM
eukprot:6109305-Pyramimonas_sp.AAC.2